MAAPAAFSLWTYHHVVDFSCRRLGQRPTRNLWLLFTPTKLLKRGCDVSLFVFREGIGRSSVFSHSLCGHRKKKKVRWSRWIKKTVDGGVNVEWNLTGVLCHWSRASIAVVCAVWHCLRVGQQFKSSFCASVCPFFFYDCMLYQSFMYCLEQQKHGLLYKVLRQLWRDLGHAVWSKILFFI